MWQLLPDDTTRQSALFPVSGHVGAYTVGRKDTDMVVSNDKSISRNHAQVTHEPDGLTLMDIGSKFGTHVNGTKLAQNEPCALAAGDKVILGTTHFTVRRRQLIFCASTLSSPEDKEELTRSTAALGATLADKWSSEVTHLIMPTVTFTPKLISALALLKPVVSLQWLRLALARTKPAQMLPDANEPSVVPALGPANAKFPADLVAVQPARKVVFRGRRFVCLSGGAGSKVKSAAATFELMEQMGADLRQWPMGAPLDYAAQMVGQGFEFLLPEGLAAQSQAASQQSQHDLPPEAATVGRAGGVVYDSAQARACLIFADASKLPIVEVELLPELPPELPPSPVIATQQGGMPSPAASQPPPRLPARRLQQDAETPVEEPEEPTQQQRGRMPPPATTGRKRREATPPKAEAAGGEEPLKRRRVATTAAAAREGDAEAEALAEEEAALEAGGRNAEERAEVEARTKARLEAEEAEAEGRAEAEAAVGAQEGLPSAFDEPVVAPPAASASPPRASEPAPDGWRKRGAGQLDALESIATMPEAETPVEIVSRAPRAPAAGPRGATGAATGAGTAAPKKGKRFVKQVVTKSVGVVEIKAAPVQTGKDEEDLRKINEDRRVGGESDEDPLDGEFDEKLANNRSGAAPARKRGTRR